MYRECRLVPRTELVRAPGLETSLEKSHQSGSDLVPVYCAHDLNQRLGLLTEFSRFRFLNALTMKLRAIE